MPRLIDAYKVRIDRDDFDTYADYITALDAVTEAPTVDAEPKWIPCSERMPEENTPVLVYVEHCVKTVQPNLEWRWMSIMYFVIRETFEEVEYSWETDNDEGFEYEFSDVKAWMPLPKPYEVKQ